MMVAPVHSEGRTRPKIEIKVNVCNCTGVPYWFVQNGSAAVLWHSGSCDGSFLIFNRAIFFNQLFTLRFGRKA